MNDPSLIKPAVFTTRQAAHALGIASTQVEYMRVHDEIHPAWRLPGLRGAYLYERVEIERVLALSDRRSFRRRRQRTKKYPMDGLVPVERRPIRRPLPLPPEVLPDKTKHAKQHAELS